MADAVEAPVVVAAPPPPLPPPPTSAAAAAVDAADANSEADSRLVLLEFPMNGRMVAMTRRDHERFARHDKWNMHEFFRFKVLSKSIVCVQHFLDFP